MNTQEIELALARVEDAVSIMYDHITINRVIPKQLFKDTVGLFANFPNVAVDAAPNMPLEWTERDRYNFISRIVTVMRQTLAVMCERNDLHQKHHIVVGITEGRMRQFTQALGTLASARSDAVTRSQHLLLSTCMHTSE